MGTAELESLSIGTATAPASATTERRMEAKRMLIVETSGYDPVILVTNG
jgi:hypothetical protein